LGLQTLHVSSVIREILGWSHVKASFRLVMIILCLADRLSISGWKM